MTTVTTSNYKIVTADDGKVFYVDGETFSNATIPLAQEINFEELTTAEAQEKKTAYWQEKTDTKEASTVEDFENILDILAGKKG